MLKAPLEPVSSTADIWALGCIFYELVTGKQSPFGEDAIFKPDLSRGTPPWDPPQLPTTLEPRVVCIITELCRATLQIDDTKRPASSDILELSQSSSWTLDVIWTFECHHYIGANNIMDAIVAQGSNEIWSCVKWAPSWYLLREMSAYAKGKSFQNPKLS
jgi:serine/threonine protein kinase